MSSLADKLSNIVGQVFADKSLPAGLGLVRVSDRPDLAQFQCNGAMAAAKTLGKSPREVAQDLIDSLKANPIFTRLDIAGPGFINIHVSDDFILHHYNGIAENSRLGIKLKTPETVVLDYGGPNIAKPMHVGHLRSSIIGDCLRRVYLAAGYKAISDVHMGDWGTPMGMILSELESRGILGRPVTMEQLEEIYPAAAKACKDDEGRMAKAREATRKLQDGDPIYTQAWRQFIDVSIAGMKANFDALSVHFDLWKGEADAHPFIENMILDMKAKGIARMSEGALIVDVQEENDKKEIPPLILLKSDGAVLYGTTDLATIIDRVKNLQPSQIVYIVDQRQSLHFEQCFRAARKAGLLAQETQLIFAGFGTMNGSDGKPFKTRAGGVMKLEDLIAMATEKARARIEEADLAKDASEDECAGIAHKVAIAAIKFADLQNQRQSDYVFDLDRMTAFEGKTGPYLLYQAVRIQSLLKKAREQNLEIAQSPLLLSDMDRPLALQIAELPDHFEIALKNQTPHTLCDYAYKLAQSFSGFYGSCHILSESDEHVRASRLSLCDQTYRHLAFVLDLLGIEIPARM